MFGCEKKREDKKNFKFWGVSSLKNGYVGEEVCIDYVYDVF